MVLIILTALLIFFMIKWIKWKTMSSVLTAWIVENKYKPPDKEDIGRLTRFVIDNVFRDLGLRR